MSVLLPNNPPYTCAVCGGEFLGHQVARNEPDAVCWMCGGWGLLYRLAGERAKTQDSAELTRNTTDRANAGMDAEPAPRGGDE